MANPINSGPVAPERNPPINPQYYSPRVAVIASITPINQTNTEVVTTEENLFVANQLIRFDLAPRTGMRDLDGKTAYVSSVTNDTTFIVQINATGLGTFDPSLNLLQDSFVAPIGNINSGAINSSGRINNVTYIEGSFINISPG